MLAKKKLNFSEFTLITATVEHRQFPSVSLTRVHTLGLKYPFNLNIKYIEISIQLFLYKIKTFGKHFYHAWLLSYLSSVRRPQVQETDQLNGNGERQKGRE